PPYQAGRPANLRRVVPKPASTYRVLSRSRSNVHGYFSHHKLRSSSTRRRGTMGCQIPGAGIDGRGNTHVPPLRAYARLKFLVPYGPKGFGPAVYQGALSVHP